MLACTDNRDKSSLRKFSGDKVIFMNVHKRYKFPTTVMVEYILSPKVLSKTSALFESFLFCLSIDLLHLSQFVWDGFIICWLRSIMTSTQKMYGFCSKSVRTFFCWSLTPCALMYFQVKPSSHDYIGIYPRDWKDLREFVGFEHPITAPFEEDNLYRIIQFTCQSPHVTASLNQDYQFVYVDQSQQVTGISWFVFMFLKWSCWSQFLLLCFASLLGPW